MQRIERMGPTGGVLKSGVFVLVQCQTGEKGPVYNDRMS